VTLVVGGVCGMVLAAVYAFVNHHDPILYVNILLAGGFGWTLGWIVSKGVRKFRVRNKAAAGVIALVVFAAAYAVHWPVYLGTVFVDQDRRLSSYNVQAILEVATELAREPEATWGIIRSLNQDGIWSISRPGSSRSGLRVSGIFLALVWLGEALIICWFAVKKPVEEAGKPYSQRQERWLEPETLPARVAFVENVEEFLNALARNDFGALTTPLPADVPNPKFAQVTLFSDAFEPYVSVQNVTSTDTNVKKKSDGLGKKIFGWFVGGSKETDTTAEVLRYLKISPTVAQNIANALRGA
jgi:hypothetical protein